MSGTEGVSSAGSFLGTEPGSAKGSLTATSTSTEPMIVKREDLTDTIRESLRVTAQAVVASAAPILPLLEVGNDPERSGRSRSPGSSSRSSVHREIDRLEKGSAASSRSGSRRSAGRSGSGKQSGTPAPKRVPRTPGTGSSWALPTPPSHTIPHFPIHTPVASPREVADARAIWGRASAKAVADTVDLTADGATENVNVIILGAGAMGGEQ